MIIRLPATTVPDTGLCFTRDVYSFFVSPLVLRAPSTDRPETLPHGRNLAEFYDPTPKIRGLTTPKKNWEPKTCKISVNFGPLQTMIANISGTAQDIQNRKRLQTTAIPPAFNEKRSGELWSTNGLEFHVSLTHQKCTFGILYLGPLGGTAP